MVKPMKMFNLSTEAMSVLTAAGWSDRYDGNSEVVTTFLESKGVTVFPIAKSFYHSFNGISLVGGGHGYFHFDAISQWDFIDEGELPTFERIVGCSLCPVGMGGRSFGFIAASGEMFFLSDEWFNYYRLTSRDWFDLVCISFQPYYHMRIDILKEQKPKEYWD